MRGPDPVRFEHLPDRPEPDATGNPRPALRRSARTVRSTISGQPPPAGRQSLIRQRPGSQADRGSRRLEIGAWEPHPAGDHETGSTGHPGRSHSRSRNRREASIARLSIGYRGALDSSPQGKFRFHGRTILPDRKGLPDSTDRPGRLALLLAPFAGKLGMPERSRSELERGREEQPCRIGFCTPPPRGWIGTAGNRIREPWPATPTRRISAGSATSASLPTSTPARPRPRNGSSTTRARSTGWGTWTRGTPRPTIWRRNASGASRSSPRRSPAAGTTRPVIRSRSTSSTPRGTWTSRRRSSGRSACSTARW